MSQAGDIDATGSNPAIPTEFITDDGSAVPIANQLEVLGAVVAAGTDPVETTGSGNTITINVQRTQAIAAADATKIGLCNFDSTSFAVDANGFVTFVGGSSGIETITGDTGGALSPTAGNFNILSTATNGIQTTGSGSTLTVAMASPYGDGSFSFSRSAAGATNTLTVENTSNTASSNALQELTVAGTSAGDAYYKAQISGGQAWTWGLDNSFNDVFSLSASATLGTSEIYSVNGSNFNTTFSSGNLSVNRSNAGATNQIFCGNSESATGTSDAQMLLQTNGGSSGDPYVSLLVNGVLGYSLGIDNSDSDCLAITNDSSFAGTNYWKMTSAGERTMPLQPYVLATRVTPTANATGDGTNVTVVYDTEIADQNSDYNIGTNVFTSPVTGKYLFTGGVSLNGILSTHTTGDFVLLGSNRNLRGASISPFACGSTGTSLVFPYAIPLDMDAGDTANFRVTVSNGTKVITIEGSGVTNNYNFMSIILQV